MNGEARRSCPRCGALLTNEATWCGQCYLNFRPRRRRVPVPPAPPRPDLVASRRDPNVAFDRVWVGTETKEPEARALAAWPCPSCGYANAIHLNACEICGTTFSKLFEESKPRPDVEPAHAAVASLFLPGLGHIRCGRMAEGIARAVLFVWAFGTGLLLLLEHPPSGAGPLGPLGGLMFMAAAGVYVFSALDAYRVAGGEDQVLSPKVLLYGSAALVVLSVISLLVLVFKASKVHP